MSGQSSFDAFIAGVERLGKLNAEAAKEAEQGVADALRESARAAETPSGEAWPECKEGGKALRGAAAAIESTTKGSQVVVKIGKPYVFHNHGAGGSSTTKEAVRARKATEARQAKSGIKSKFHAPRRQILPDAGEPIPSKVNEAIQAASKRVFEKAMGG